MKDPTMRLSLLAMLLFAGSLRADPPVVQYLFPAGGQRGTTVDLHVGGLYLYESCNFEMIGTGVVAPPRLTRVASPSFEGPILPLPDSQRQEDYPRAMMGKIQIAKDAPLGFRTGNVWTSQGVSPTWKFIIGDLPEVLEKEQDGEPIPVELTTPITANGRIYPREDIDIWTFKAKVGQTFRCRAEAGRFGSTLIPQLELIDPSGMKIDESPDLGREDSELVFTAKSDGLYSLRIRDANVGGGPTFVYRLSISEPTKSSPRPDEPNDIATAKLLPNDGVIGCIDRGGDVDCWSINGRKGVSIDVACKVHTDESRLLPVLTLYSADGKELSKSETSSLVFTPTVDGQIFVRVEDRFPKRGGSDFTYQLRSSESKPDFELSLLLSTVTVNRAGEGKLKINVQRRGGFNAPIALQFDNLPAGVTVNGTPIVQAGQNSIDVSFKADAKAPIRCERIGIRGVGWLPISAFTSLQRPISHSTEPVRLAVSLPTPFKIVGEYVLKLVPRGTVYVRRYRVERTGFDGPILIELADRQSRHLQGAWGPKVQVAAGQNEFEFATTLPPWMETGRTCRVCVMGTAVVKDIDGSEHIVSYSSVQQNDQIIAVVEPGKLGIEVDRTSLRVEAGASIEVRVKVARSSTLNGPAKVEVLFPDGFTGLQAQPLSIPADQTEGKLILKFASEGSQIRVPPGMPLVIRAGVIEAGHPIAAESRMDVVK